MTYRVPPPSLLCAPFSRANQHALVQYASCQIVLSLPQIQLGCEDYLFPNLAALSFQLNQHSSPAPPQHSSWPPLPAPPQPDLLSHGKATLFASNLATAPAIHPSPSVLVEKLPSFIQVENLKPTYVHHLEWQSLHALAL